MLKQSHVVTFLSTFLLISCINVHCKIIEIELNDNLPKNIMVGTFFNDENHIKPMLDICTILGERGYKVIMVSPTTSPEYPTIKHVSLDSQIIVNEQEISLRKYPDTIDMYKKTAREYNIDLFLCDVMINDACLDVAQLLNKPLVGYVSFLHESARVNIKPRYDDLYKKFKDSLFLANTFYGFELPQYLPPNVLEIGPVLSDKYPPLTRELLSFINSHNKILYVNLDTHSLVTAENNNILLQSFIEAINKKIIDGVIWSSSKSFLKDNLADGTQNPNIYVTDSTSRFSILKHNNTKLFLNNGDGMSSYESLYTATPMLLMPILDNQMGNSEKLNIAGVGIILNQFQLNVKDILNKIDLMLKGEQVKKNVKRLENLTKINSKRKYKAVDLIEYILYTTGENINEESLLKELITTDVQIGFNRKHIYDTYGNFILGIGFVIFGGVLYVIMRLFRLLIRFELISFGSNVKKD